MHNTIDLIPIKSDPHRTQRAPEKPSRLVEAVGAAYVLASMPALWYSAPRAVEWIANFIRGLI